MGICQHKSLLILGAAATLLLSPDPVQLSSWVGLGVQQAHAAGKGHDKREKPAKREKSDKSQKADKPKPTDRSQKEAKAPKEKNSAPAKRKSHSTLGITSNGDITFKSKLHNIKPPKPSALAGTRIKERSLKAQLAGLNSLSRNINGLMNSSDPRMNGIRAFVTASAELALSDQRVEQVQTARDQAKSEYMSIAQSFGLIAYDGDPTVYSDLSMDALAARLDTLDSALNADPQNTAIAAEIAQLGGAIETLSQSDAYVALSTADTELAAVQAKAGDLQAATSDGALKRALLDAASANRVAETGAESYLTPEILDWAKQVLGVGDYQGLIDAYLAQQESLGATYAAAKADNSAALQ